MQREEIRKSGLVADREGGDGRCREGVGGGEGRPATGGARGRGSAGTTGGETRHQIDSGRRARIQEVEGKERGGGRGRAGGGG